MRGFGVRILRKPGIEEGCIGCVIGQRLAGTVRDPDLQPFVELGEFPDPARSAGLLCQVAAVKSFDLVELEEIEARLDEECLISPMQVFIELRV